MKKSNELWGTLLGMEYSVSTITACGETIRSKSEVETEQKAAELLMYLRNNEDEESFLKWLRENKERIRKIGA